MGRGEEGICLLEHTWESTMCERRVPAGPGREARIFGVFTRMVPGTGEYSTGDIPVPKEPELGAHL